MEPAGPQSKTAEWQLETDALERVTTKITFRDKLPDGNPFYRSFRAARS